MGEWTKSFFLRGMNCQISLLMMKTAARPTVNIITMCFYKRSELCFSIGKRKKVDLALGMYDWDFPCPFRQTKIPNTRSTNYQTVSNERPFSHDGQCVFHGSFFFAFYFLHRYDSEPWFYAPATQTCQYDAAHDCAVFRAMLNKSEVWRQCLYSRECENPVLCASSVCPLTVARPGPAGRFSLGLSFYH